MRHTSIVCPPRLIRPSSSQRSRKFSTSVPSAWSVIEYTIGSFIHKRKICRYPASILGKMPQELARNIGCVELSESNGWLFKIQKVHKVCSGSLNEEANEDLLTAIDGA
ncbi:hypothetical protein X801_03907 [Opisthorchis viverrini]|uniref:Uncharacterized protein n=1 Tax=Opisthorchis viverrini TaxID=6198 RepID=A0A1S8X0J9_OPIVI|nr:hypothetical protein X801_03907 [Opisthorchis viverrini]